MLHLYTLQLELTTLCGRFDCNSVPDTNLIVKRPFSDIRQRECYGTASSLTNLWKWTRTTSSKICSFCFCFLACTYSQLGLPQLHSWQASSLFSFYVTTLLSDRHDKDRVQTVDVGEMVHGNVGVFLFPFFLFYNTLTDTNNGLLH